VKEIENFHSIASVISANGSVNLIRRGDKIEPISSAKAKQLADSKKFASSRPSVTNATMEEILKSDNTHSATLYQESAQMAATSDNLSSEMEVAPQSTASGQLLENESTDPAEVVATYGLSPGETNVRRIMHLGAKSAGGKVAYDKYVELVNSYGGDYLAAFRAGEIALGMGENAEARKWFDKALSINPNYQPAQDALKNIK
jgi:tetratricopeptide (TPR) repeat protein